MLYGSGERRFDVTYYHSNGQARTWSTRFEGVIPNLERRYQQTESDYHQRQDSGVYARDSLPVLRRATAAAGGAFGDDWRRDDP